MTITNQVTVSPLAKEKKSVFGIVIVHSPIEFANIMSFHLMFVYPHVHEEDN